MLRRTAPRNHGLLRATNVLLAGMKPYHEWHMHEPLLQDYEGWRILDNNKMTKFEAYLTDFAGHGRHLDPIIDDPRLTHKQRVCRLYRWALKELIMYFTNSNASKFNIGYKVVRKRFEKYRYVTDPGMCDMMVRESQKYLREICMNSFFRRDPRSKDTPQCLTNPMFHPDNALVYDHWTHYEEQLYGDAKIHRYSYHHPNMSPLPEMHERFGDPEEGRRYMRNWVVIVTAFIYSMGVLWGVAFFHDPGWHDPYFDVIHKHYHQETIQAMETFERNHRGRYSQASVLSMDWDTVLGKVNQKVGYWNTGGRFTDQNVIPRNPWQGKEINQ